MSRTFNVVNKSVRKIDAMALALGRPMFVADKCPADALIIKFLWSPHAHARITAMDISGAESMPGVHAVLYHGNVPRIPHTTAGQGYPEPSPYDTYMFDTKVRYVGDRVAAVAADTVEIAEKALAAIKVEYEVLPAVLNLDDAMKSGAPVIHDESDTFAKIPVPYEPQKNMAAFVGMDVRGRAPRAAHLGGDATERRRPLLRPEPMSPSGRVRGRRKHRPDSSADPPGAPRAEAPMTDVRPT
jgi:putative selenate reductase molybdopterin-binding subunit